jgi:DNA replication protein DnaC
MRHDPAAGAIVIMLRSLKMYGMAQAVTDLIEQGAPAFEAAIPMLSQLLKAELAEREVRSIAYHMKSARFPAYKDLSGFDFATSEINEATVRILHRCEFMDGAQNVVLIGGPGTGKTHLGCAIVTALDLLLYQAQYSTVADFSAAVRECYKDGAKHTEKQVMQRYTKPDLLVLDEVGASSGSDHEKQILFEAMNERYNNVLPTVLISNLTQADITAYLGERIMDRMREGGGKLLRLDWESYRK